MNERSSTIDDTTLNRVEDCLRSSPPQTDTEVNQLIDDITKTYLQDEDDQDDSAPAYRLAKILKMNLENPELFIPTKLDLTPLLGGREGSFGVVHKASWHGAEVAVKVLKESEAVLNQKYNQLRNGFLYEVKIWRSIAQHPNVLRFDGCYATVNFTKRDIDLALVSPWAKSGDLRKYKTTFKPWIKTHSILLDVAQGLQHLHTNNPQVVHGDLCRANVLLDIKEKKLMAKLADFGMAKHDGRESSLTVLGMTADLHYERRGPLQKAIRGRSTDNDIFGFGSLIYEIFAGQADFTSQKPIRPSTMNDGKYDKLWLLVEDCWSDEPEKKLNASDLIDRLKELAPKA
ncbi:hypothetical protein D9758_017978 [Tetrapyrgos nigripes]|uniref:Protein kinase domain-containing protein n=1 Tax=Tetrapyrgos nigripes TaxID=182062 RepID=A0A8H5C3T0_9AGAR|nr:hypothetical protein D9758_017978 [Tetrapyrgos nigripes]